MNDFNFTQWISIVGPLGGLMFAMFVFLYHAIDRNNERWLDTQGKILAIMSKLEMQYIVPKPKKKIN